MFEANRWKLTPDMEQYPQVPDSASLRGGTATNALPFLTLTKQGMNNLMQHVLENEAEKRLNWQLGRLVSELPEYKRRPEEDWRTALQARLAQLEPRPQEYCNALVDALKGKGEISELAVGRLVQPFPLVCRTAWPTG